MEEMSISLVIASNKVLRDICFKIREEVFCVEQNIPTDLERDDTDLTAVHYLLNYNNKFVATARLYFDDEKLAHIGRVAVLKEYRGKNLGKQIMQEIIDNTKTDYAHKCKSITLGAQIYAKQFYQKLGFETYGEEYMDAGIPHINMELFL
jgi:predicted GNAT family N-acyltransferase